MADMARSASHQQHLRESAAPPRLPVLALGASLSSFLAISYVLCVLYHIAFPNQTVTDMWFAMFPGFTWLTWQSFVLGLVEVVVLGWYAARSIISLPCAGGKTSGPAGSLAQAPRGGG